MEQDEDDETSASRGRNASPPSGKVHSGPTSFYAGFLNIFFDIKIFEGTNVLLHALSSCVTVSKKFFPNFCRFFGTIFTPISEKSFMGHYISVTFCF